MGIWPEAPIRPHKPIISTHSPEALGREFAGLELPALVSYVLTIPWTFLTPFVLREPFLVRKVWWYNGATVNGVVEVGVWDANFQKVVSGSATMAGANVLQEVDVTDVLLGPGRYHLAWSSDSPTAAFFLFNLVGVGLGGATGQVGNFTDATPLPAAFNTANLYGSEIGMVCGISSRLLVV